MARLILNEGETFGTVGGFAQLTIFGSNGREKVILASDAKVEFDASFNRGGDTISILGNAGLYSARLQGSALLLSSISGATIVLPVGTVATTIEFADATRSLVFNGTAVLLGSQAITASAAAVAPGAGAGNGLVVITDASGGPDLVTVADASVAALNTSAGTTAQALPFASQASYDFYRVSDLTRLPFAQLPAGSVPTAYNFGLHSYTLGVGTDRVDYSRTDDTIVSVASGAGNTAFVLVNGDGTDSNFASSRSDRVDGLVGVEEIVASTGRSTIDLTPLARDTRIVFDANGSRLIGSGDLAESTVVITGAGGEAIAGLADHVEQFDAGKDSLIAVTTAAWTILQGSDFDEVVSYEGFSGALQQAKADHRFTQDFLNLRGGDNIVDYLDVNASIIADIDFTAFRSSNPTQSGLIDVTLEFRDIAGLNFLGWHQIRSHSPINQLAEGTLKLAAHEGGQDQVTFTGSLGTRTIRLGGEAGVVEVLLGNEQAMVLTGFETVVDGKSADVYDLPSLDAWTSATRFDDNTDDQDTIRVGTDAASSAYNFSAGGLVIDIDGINGALSARHSDTVSFDVLDITRIEGGVRTVLGSGGSDSELVLGKVGLIDTVNDFASLVFTAATVAEAATSFAVDTTGAGTRIALGIKTITTNQDVMSFSFGGNVAEGQLGNGQVASVSSGVNFTVKGTDSVAIYGGDGSDTLTAAGGQDVLFGGRGADVLDGGNVAGAGARLTFGFDRQVTRLGPAGSLVSILRTGDENLTAASPAVTSFQVIPNADVDQIGAAWAAVQLATWRDFFDPDDSGLTTAAANALEAVAYDAVAKELSFQFAPGVAISVAELTDTVAIGATGGAAIAGIARASANTAAIESADRFLYTAAEQSTAAAMDTLVRFTVNVAGVSDRIDLSGIDARETIDGDQSFEGLGRDSAVRTDLAQILDIADNAGAMVTFDIFIGRTINDTYIIIDTNQSGAYNAGDMVIKLSGVTDIAGITLENNFIL